MTTSAVGIAPRGRADGDRIERVAAALRPHSFEALVADLADGQDARYSAVEER